MNHKSNVMGTVLLKEHVVNWITFVKRLGYLRILLYTLIGTELATTMHLNLTQRSSNDGWISEHDIIDVDSN